MGDITDGSALQQYLLLAKSAKGKACAAVIQQALSAANVYVFGELLDMANVQQLAGTEDAKMLELLKIFAFGTWQDYKANAATFGPLTPSQTKKLKQLTIVTLASQSKLIPYTVLQQQLEIQELRELEDLIIDAVYQGIIQGSLDQKSKQLEVEFSMGRDLKPDDLDNMLATLHTWASQADTIMKSIKEKIQHANTMSDIEKKRKEDFEKRVENVKANIKANMEAEMLQAAELEGAEGYFGEGERRKGRGKGMKGFNPRDANPHHPAMQHHRDVRERRG